jgi:glycerophosphoryl diester phosphodiesterase
MEPRQVDAPDPLPLRLIDRGFPRS